MEVSTIQYVLWFMPALLQVLVVSRMLVKRLYKDFPIFFAYTIFHLVEFVIGISAANVSREAYYYVYWSMDTIDSILSIALVQEVFSHVFRPYEALRTLGNALFKWSAIILIGICFVSAAAAPGTDQDRLTAAFMVLQRSAGILVGGLLLLLFMFCRMFGLRWRRYVLGIALGMGIIATVVTGLSAVRAHFGLATETIYNLIQPLAYNVAVMVWVWSVYSREDVEVDLRAPKADELVVWNRALQELLNR